ncbi:MAG: hypothetical protein AAF631_10820 [Pseudomonadota bacterium]
MTATDTALKSASTALGAGTIIARSLKLFFRNFLRIAVLGLVPMVGLQVAGAWVAGVILQAIGPANDTASVGVVIVYLFFALGAFGLVVATITLFAYDTLERSPRPLWAYIVRGLRFIVPILALSVFCGILIYIGTAFFVVPGLWLAAVFSMVFPAIVVEGTGLTAVGRSARLTKGYRWPIIGTLLVMGFITGLMVLGVAAFLGLFISGVENAVGGGAWLLNTGLALLVGSFLYAISFGLPAVTTALIYARLREIKEGTSIADITEVFA